jgi:hypothetical protein
MTANAGYHAYATGDVLTAAQVQYNLQNQTVMYFATTTARDAALTGSILVDGMVSYTPATGLMYYNGTAWTTVGSSSPLTTKGDIYGYSTTNARIPVGSNNQVLTADSTQTLGVKWATPATGSMTLLSTTTLSGTTTTISSISQSYSKLYLSVYGVTNATASPLSIWPNNSTSTTGEICIRGVAGTPTWAATTSGALYLVGQTSAQYLIPNNASNGFSVYIDAYTTSNADKPFQMYGEYPDNADGNPLPTMGAGGIKQTAAITSLVFSCQSTGSFTGGTVLVYGVN